MAPVLLGLIVSLIALCAVVDVACAAPPFSAADTITDAFQKHAREWESALNRIAISLFWLLVAIDLAWSAGRLIIRGADIGEWLSELLSQILIIGFFYALLEHSAEWARLIIGGFQKAADQAAAASGVQGGSRPSDIFNAGVFVAGKIWEATSIFNPLSVGLVIAAIIVIICFAFMAAFMVVALVETYIVISAGVLFMGFGGSRWTKTYAVNMLHYSVAAGAKLFVAQLIAALAQQLFKDINWLSFNFGASSYDTIVIIGLSIMLFVLMWTVPGIAQGVVKGESASSPGSMVAAAAMLKESAAALAKAAAALSTGAAGLARAGAAAGTLASSQLGPSASSRERLNRAMRNFGGAVLSTAGARLSNRINRGFFGEVASNLNAASEPDGPDNVIRGGDASGAPADNPGERTP